MPFTTTYTVTTTYQDVVANSETRRITIAEDPSVALWPTVDFLIRKPTSSNTPIRKAIGTSYSFEAQDGSVFLPGKVVGQVAVTAGSTTFQQDEA